MKKKIKTLFKYRKLPFLLSYLEKGEAKKLNKQLVDLQVAIYNLDLYLESNWKLKNKELKKYWKKIFASLKDIGLNAEEAYNYTSHIRRYQKHETQLRENKMPTLLNKEYYYYYKSCDVRLMREIIYKKEPKVADELSLEDWRYFDLITEINDDVEDVFEDQETINGNMFLIQIVEEGLDSARLSFEKFITELASKEKRHINGDSSPTRRKVNKWTKQAVKDTRKLLISNCNKLKKKPIITKMPLIKNNVLSES